MTRYRPIPTRRMTRPFLARVTASAAAELRDKNALPAHESAAVNAAARLAIDYLKGRARFPLLSQIATDNAFEDDDDAPALSGLGSFLKKTFKKVEDVAKAAIPLGVSAATTLIPGAGPALAPITGQLAAGLVAPEPKLAPGTPTALTAPAPVYVAAQPAEKMVFGIPERYVPFVVLGLLLLLKR